MINHHPKHALLKEFVDGSLPVSVAVIVASHIEMCRECQARVRRLTEIAALEAFEMTDNALWQDEFNVSSAADNTIMNHGSMPASDASLLTSIVHTPFAEQALLPRTVNQLEIAGTPIALPRAIKAIPLKEWNGLGKVSRARLNLDDQPRRTSLLHIAKGGTIPCHTHNGVEITLLIQGSFTDEFGSYHAGDFICLNSNHTHSPVTTQGCVCLTVSDAALRFTQGLSKMLNPLGKLIY